MTFAKLLTFLLVPAFIVVLGFILSSVKATRTVDNYLSKADNQRIQQIFSDGIKSSDLQTIYYSVINSKAIPADVKANLCKKLPGFHTESKLNVSKSI